MRATADISRPAGPLTTPSGPPLAAPAAPILITREGEQRLRRELAVLREEIDVHLPQRLRLAREFGEASGNDDYLQICEETAITTARINSLSRILASAKVVRSSERAAGLVTIGSIVTLRVGGRQIERRLLGSHEPVGADGMSVASPIGRAVIGRPVGAKVVAEMPSGKIRTLKIVAVRSHRSTSVEMPAAA